MSRGSKPFYSYTLLPISIVLYVSKRILDRLFFYRLAEDGNDDKNDKRDGERNDLGVDHVPRVPSDAVRTEKILRQTDCF